MMWELLLFIVKFTGNEFICEITFVHCGGEGPVHIVRMKRVARIKTRGRIYAMMGMGQAIRRGSI
jgi:hypothetical protein